MSFRRNLPTTSSSIYEPYEISDTPEEGRETTASEEQSEVSEAYDSSRMTGEGNLLFSGMIRGEASWEKNQMWPR